MTNQEKTKVWQQVGDNFFLRDNSSQIGGLKQGVYNLQITPIGELYLQRLSDGFVFDFKIYGMETEFIKKVLKTYQNTKGNLGVLFNGIKGTGKTITAEIIANELKLPVIVLGFSRQGLNEFLTSIYQDIVIFVDEYEKVFKGGVSDEDYDYDQAKGDSTLLSIMDGVYKTEFRKVFLLTTNKVWVNENMIARPSRIRYLKEFKDLNAEQIDEIIEDCLVDKKFKKDLVGFLKPLKIITVDIVKCIISEINIFNEPPVVCCKDFNLSLSDDTYTIYKYIR